MKTRIWLLGALLSGLALSSPGPCRAEAVVPPAEAQRAVVVRDVMVQEGSVSGTVVNRSSATVRAVSLRLEQEWQWSDERHPGADSPGRTLSFTLPGDVAPSSTAQFRFDTPRLPARTDGTFVSSMDVSGFTEVRP